LESKIAKMIGDLHTVNIKVVMFGAKADSQIEQQTSQLEVKVEEKIKLMTETVQYKTDQLKKDIEKLKSIEEASPLARQKGSTKQLNVDQPKGTKNERSNSPSRNRRGGEMKGMERAIKAKMNNVMKGRVQFKKTEPEKGKENNQEEQKTKPKSYMTTQASMNMSEDT